MLYELIRTLNKEEVRLFKLLLSRTASEKDRKTEALFELLRDSETLPATATQVETIYGQDNPQTRNNLYGLSNRLTRELKRSLDFHHFNYDTEHLITHNFRLGQLLRKQGRSKVAVEMLEKVIRDADKEDLVQIQDLALQELLKIAAEDSSIDVAAIIKQREEVAEKLRVLRESQNATALLNQRLRRSNFSDRDTDILVLMADIRQQLHDYASIYNSPKGRIRVFNITANILLQTQAFWQLERYLKSEYEDFEQQGFFTKSTHRTRIIMLVWLINTTFKRYKFDESLAYCDALRKALADHQKLHWNAFILHYYLGLVNNYSGLGQTDRALLLLNRLAKDKEYQSGEAGLVVMLNLATAHFEGSDAKKALQSLSQIWPMDGYDQMEARNQMLLHLFELVVRYEAQDLEFMETRLQQIEKRFSTLFANDPAKTDFLQALRHLNHVALNGLPLQANAAIERVMTQAGGFLPGDNEILDYKVWLRSVLEGIPYRVLLQESFKANRALVESNDPHLPT